MAKNDVKKIRGIEMRHQELNSAFTQALNKQWPSFSQAVLNFTQELGLQDFTLDCDHVALRVNELDIAQDLLVYWQTQGKVISDNVINGRPIYIIALDTPLQIGEWLISCVELPFPSKKYQQQGWEHIEVVIPGEATTMEQLEADLALFNPQLAALVESDSTIKIKRSSPQGEKERLPNPTIAFKRDDICIKIHSASIRAVLASEAND